MGKISTASSINEKEIAKFSALADEWWNERGKFKPLHRLNPVRIAYIRDKVCAHFGPSPDRSRPLKGLTILDVGCGGGLLSEPLARLGAKVTGIDAGQTNIEIAKKHAIREKLEIEYIACSAEDLAEKKREYDVVLSMEVVEHVASVETFINACANLVKPGGVMFTATLNRTPKSFLYAILGAEYILRWLPRGTHDWNKFLQPAEIERHMRKSDLLLKEIQGVNYRPGKGSWILSSDISVNYMMLAEKKD